MSNNKENFIRADPVPTDAEIELAVGRLRPNWTRGVPRARTGGASHILQSLAHGRSHAVVLEIKRSPRRVSPIAGLRGLEPADVISTMFITARGRKVSGPIMFR